MPFNRRRDCAIQHSEKKTCAVEISITADGTADVTWLDRDVNSMHVI